jgi:hypothetical protein
VVIGARARVVMYVAPFLHLLAGAEISVKEQHQLSYQGLDKEQHQLSGNFRQRTAPTQLLNKVVEPLPLLAGAQAHHKTRMPTLPRFPNIQPR